MRREWEPEELVASWTRRVLVLDTDWGTTAVNGDGRRLTQRVLKGFGDHITQGWIGRQLPGLFH